MKLAHYQMLDAFQRRDVAASLIVGYRGKYWCWNSASGFTTVKSVTYYRYAELWAEYCNED